jgi:protein phosphatase
LQDLVAAGVITTDEARTTPGKNLVTRALGGGRHAAAEIAPIEVLESDWLLLCSDGLNDMLTDAAIAAELTATLPDANRAAERLIDRANAAGGLDNCSVVVLRARS